MINQYYGATTYLKGATYLNSKAILNVKEGYKIGATTEYNNLGDYEVEDFSNNGVNDQFLQVNAHSRIVKTSYNNSTFTRNFTNHINFFEGFDNQNSVDNHFELYDGSSTMVFGSSSTIRIANDTYNYVNFMDNQNINDGRIIAKVQSNHCVTEYHLFGINFRQTNIITPASKQGYEAAIVGYDTDQVQLKTFNGTGGVSILATGTINPTNDNWYWLMVIFKGNNIQVFTSVDGQNYTKRINFYDDKYSSGIVGLAHSWGGATGAALTCDYIDIAEIGNQYTSEDIIRESLGMIGFKNVWVQPELDGVSGFQSSVGSSWTVGITGGYQQVDIHHDSGGDSWHTFMCSGYSFNDFVLECEGQGTSGSYLGLIVGNTKFFYGNLLRCGVSGDTGIENIFNGERTTYEFYANHICLIPDTWYRLKLIKNNIQLNWYVNDILAGSFMGTSFFDIDASAHSWDSNRNKVGLFSYRNGASGYTTSFRNLRISKLDNLVDNVSIEPNSDINSVIGRYLPEGFAINQHGNTVEIFEIGASRGEFGLTNYVQNSNEALSNISGEKYTYAKSEQFDNFNINSNSRIVNQLDSSRYGFIQDDNIHNDTEALEISRQNQKSVDRNTKSYSAAINTRIDLENYDTVNLVDVGLGISKQMLVFNNEKAYDAGSGDFKQNLQLVEKL